MTSYDGYSNDICALVVGVEEDLLIPGTSCSDGVISIGVVWRVSSGEEKIAGVQV